MHRFVVVLFSLCFTLSLAVAQDQEPQEETFPRAAKLGGGVGFTPTLLFPDLAPINQVLRNANAAELASGPIIQTGGQIYGYILFVQNLRVGGQWGSGSLSSHSVLGSVRRDVELSARYGGVTIEYVVPLADRLDLTVGTLLGGGGIELTINRDDGTPKDWSQIWTEVGSNTPATNYTRKLTGSYFIYYPSVNLEYAVLRYLGVRLGAGYMGMAGGSWKLDDKYETFGVPTSVNGKGFTVNAGIFLGTFIF